MNRKPNRGGGKFNKPNRGGATNTGDNNNSTGGDQRGGGGRGGGRGRGNFNAARGPTFPSTDASTQMRDNAPGRRRGDEGGGLISMSDTSQFMIEDLLKNLKEDNQQQQPTNKGAKQEFTQGKEFEENEQLMVELMGMGFSEEDVRNALQHCDNRDAALDYLYV